MVIDKHLSGKSMPGAVSYSAIVLVRDGAYDRSPRLINVPELGSYANPGAAHVCIVIKR